MAFYTPKRAPIDWANVKQPDPNDDWDLLAWLVMLLVMAVVIVYTIKSGGL